MFLITYVDTFQGRRGPRRRGARFVTCRVKLSFGSRENEEKEIEGVNYAKDENNYGDAVGGDNDGPLIEDEIIDLKK